MIDIPKYSDNFVSFQTITTVLSIKKEQKRPSNAEIIARLHSEDALTLGIVVSPEKEIKDPTTQRIKDMQNQTSMRVSIDIQDNPVHVMFFTNLKLTITGIRSLKPAKYAIKKILKVIPEAEHILPLKIRNATLHYRTKFPIKLHETACVLSKYLPKEYIVSYQSDIGGKTIKIYYESKTPESTTFIIQRSGSIMHCVSEFRARKKHYKNVMKILINNRSVIEAK